MSRLISLSSIFYSICLILMIPEGIIAENTTSSSPQHLNGTQNNTFVGLLGEAWLNLTGEATYKSGLTDLIDSYNKTQNGTTDEDDEDVSEEDKFIEKKKEGIISEHIDFVMLRLKHLSMSASSNITELLALQQEEFEINEGYKNGWESAERSFNNSKRDDLYNTSAPDSIVRKVPDEYHIAIIAYTGWMYSRFNKDTREVCSGSDIEKFKWKSYFKLLHLAIETLGTQEERWRDSRRFLYRGASHEYVLKEGQVIAFQHFVSTSVTLKVAENFAEKTIFEFQGLYNGTAMAVWDHSYFNNEKEYLFSPLQVFEVDSVHVGKHYTRYVLVKHDLPPPCDQQNSIGLNNIDITGNSLRALSSGAVSGIHGLIVTFSISCINILF